jgi:predicted nucleic acid-binding protein
VTTFVDTSAFQAVLSETDSGHDRALRWLERTTAEEDEDLVTTNYVVVETSALMHARLGGVAVRAFVDDLLPVCSVQYVDATLHARSVSAYLASLSRRSSLVDRVSFELMREMKIRRAFTFHRDFAREGFETVP